MDPPVTVQQSSENNRSPQGDNGETPVEVAGSCSATPPPTAEDGSRTPPSALSWNQATESWGKLSKIGDEYHRNGEFVDENRDFGLRIWVH